MAGIKVELKRAGILDPMYQLGYMLQNPPRGREIGKPYKMNYVRGWRMVYH
jgi:hypothetical protein